MWLPVRRGIAVRMRLYEGYATIKVELLQVATCQLMSWGTVLMGEHHS